MRPAQLVRRRIAEECRTEINRRYLIGDQIPPLFFIPGDTVTVRFPTSTLPPGYFILINFQKILELRLNESVGVSFSLINNVDFVCISVEEHKEIVS